MMEWYRTYRARLFLLLRYGISGVVGALIQTTALYIWISVLGLQRTYLLGVVFGFVLALITVFMLQKYWAFRDRGPTRTSQQFISYTLIALIGLVLNTGLFAVAKTLFQLFSLDFFHRWYLIVEILIIVLVSAFSFCMNFFFTFRPMRQEPIQPQ